VPFLMVPLVFTLETCDSSLVRAKTAVVSLSPNKITGKFLGGKGPGWHQLQNKNKYYTNTLTLSNRSMAVETNHLLFLPFFLPFFISLFLSFFLVLDRANGII
jgi:hypothetical protein